MIDLKGSIVKFEINIENALESKHESIDDDKYHCKTMLCLEWVNSTIVNNLHFQNILSNHFDSFGFVSPEW